MKQARTTKASPCASKSRIRPSAGERDLLLALALHERPLPIAWISSITPESADVDSLLASNALIETKEGLGLASGIDPAEVEKAAPWSHRQRLHSLLARLCRQPPARLDLAGHHFEQAGKNSEAARAYLDAAEVFCRSHRHAGAKRMFFAALRILPPETGNDEIIAALRNLAQCAPLATDTSDAIARLRHWIQSPPWSARAAVRAEANLVLAGMLAGEGRHAESARVRRSAGRDLAALGRDSEAAAASMAATAVLGFAGQFGLALEAAEAAVHTAARVRNPELDAQAATAHGLILGMSGRTAEGVSELQRALDIALGHKLTGAAAEAYRFLGTVQEYASLYPDEQSAFTNALKYCRKYGATATEGSCLGCLAYSCLRSGNWRRSGQVARKVIADRKIPEASRYVAESVLGLLHAYRGEIRPARRLLRQSLEHSRRIGLLLMDFFNLHGLAMIAESQGELEDASARWLELLEFWRATDDRHDAIPGLSAAVSFFAGNGRPDDAAAAAEALTAIASATSNPEATGAAYAATGELILLEGRAGRAASEFKRAIIAFDQRVLSVEPIRARLQLGRALIQDGAMQKARDPLRDALQRARRLGARPLAAQAERLLVAPAPDSASCASDEEPQTGWELLSARQREVARQIALGRTNKEIAARLSVSVRTVDMHVAHVLSRLGCRTRTEAATRITAALE